MLRIDADLWEEKVLISIEDTEERVTELLLAGLDEWLLSNCVVDS